MIDIDRYESMSQLFLDFIDTASDEADEAAWKNKLTMLDELLAEVKRLREQYTELREALVGDSPNWTHEELIEQALELSKPVELEFGEWHTDEGDD